MIFALPTLYQKHARGKSCDACCARLPPPVRWPAMSQRWKILASWKSLGLKRSRAPQETSKSATDEHELVRIGKQNADFAAGHDWVVSVSICGPWLFQLALPSPKPPR